MRLATEEDIPMLNEILNSPGVNGGASMGTGIQMDVEPVMRAGSIIFTNGVGAVSFTPTVPGQFEGHMFFLPEGRGKKAIDAVIESCEMMFDRGAEKITARIPVSYKSSRLLTRRAGFKSAGTGTSDYGMGIVRETEFFEMEKKQCRF